MHDRHGSGRHHTSCRNTTAASRPSLPFGFDRIHLVTRDLFVYSESDWGQEAAQRRCPTCRLQLPRGIDPASRPTCCHASGPLLAAAARRPAKASPGARGGHSHLPAGCCCYLINFRFFSRPQHITAYAEDRLVHCTAHIPSSVLHLQANCLLEHE